MELIELFVLGVIVLLQFVLFFRICNKISIFSKIFKSSYHVGIESVVDSGLPVVNENEPDESGYSERLYSEESYNGPKLLSLTHNLYFKNIITTINAYLSKNKVALVDFHILKDIVERNVESVEDEIVARLPAPLYLGLAATMIGIIIGLWGIDDVSNPDSMAPVINSVKYAMSASALGLLLTTLLSILIFKEGKKNSEEGKNVFLSFLQTELLPKISQSEDAGIQELNKRLNDFGYSSIKIVDNLDKIVKRTEDTIKKQHALIKELNQIDLIRVAEFNVTVFQQLSGMMEEFQAFPKYYNELNASLSNTTALNNNLIQLLERSADVGVAISEVKNISEKSNESFSFFNKHIESFEKYGDAVNKAVGIADDKMGKAIDSLQESVTMQFDKHSNVIAKSQSKLEDIIVEFVNTVGDVTDPRFKKLDKLEEIDRSLVEIKKGIKDQTKVLSKISTIQSGGTLASPAVEKSILNTVKGYLQLVAYIAVIGIGIYLLTEIA